MSKVRLELRVDPATKAFLEDIKKSNNYTSLNQSFEFVVKNYFDKISDAYDYEQKADISKRKEIKARKELTNFKETYSGLISVMDEFKMNMNKQVEDFKEVISLQKS